LPMLRAKSQTAAALITTNKAWARYCIQSNFGPKKLAPAKLREGVYLYSNCG
jgi:hypothetical protein